MEEKRVRVGWKEREREVGKEEKRVKEVEIGAVADRLGEKEWIRNGEEKRKRLLGKKNEQTKKKKREKRINIVKDT